jgi:pyroglutamyl-peptidase
VLPTLWEVAASFPAQLKRLQPDVVLMIGLASRRREVCIEVIGRNATGRFPDAARVRPIGTRLIAGGTPARRCVTEWAPLLQALKRAGVPARVSRNAGGYICNALAYGAYGWAQAAGPARLAVFVHIPHPRPGGIPAAKMRHGLEALLVALVAQQRHARLTAATAR